MDITASIKQRPSPALDHLPQEVIDQIIQEQCLGYADLLSLRLVSRDLSQAILPAVFETVTLSKLSKDKDAFLAIAGSPHLAPYVKTLVWQELDLKPWLNSPSRSDTLDGDDDDIAEVKTHMFNAIFNHHTERGSPLEKTFWCLAESWKNQDFETQFLLALNALSNLNMFVSQPMPPRRPIPYKQFPLWADLFENLAPVVHEEANNHEGLLYYLLPALNQTGTMNVRHLTWTSTTEPIQGLDLSQTSDITNLSILESLSVNLSKGGAEILEKLLLFATGLKCLKICLGNTDDNSPSVLRTEEQDLYDQFLGSPTLSSRPLVSLTLVDASVSLEALIAFIEGHAHSLRHLYLYNCWMKLTDLHRVWQSVKPKLQVPSLKVLYSRASATYLIREDHSFDFVHGHPPSFSESEAMHTENEKITDCKLTTILDKDYREKDPDGEWPGFGYVGFWFQRPEDECHNRQTWPADMFPMWSWGRFGESNSLYYWQTGIDHERRDYWQTGGALPICTYMWRYKHRDGRQVFNNTDLETLEYFSDWDSDAGDEVSPTPYNILLTDEALNPRMAAKRDESPPENAVLYNQNEDPYWPY